MQRRLIAGAEWLVLLPLWRKWVRSRDVRLAAAMTTGALWFVIAATLVGTFSDEDSRNASGRTAAQSSATARPERTPRPTRTQTASRSPNTIVPATPETTSAPAAAPTASTGHTPGGATPDGFRAPTPAAPLVVVNSGSYTDSDGGYHVVGEVRNSTSDYMDYVEITGTFLDAAGQVVASEYTFTHVDLVAPGETAGFDLMLANGAGLGVSRYELAVQGEVSAERPAPGLVIQGESANVDGGGDYHIVGMVVNQSAAIAEFVKVIGTFYGADGTVIRSDFTYTDLEVVPPGGSDTFDLSLPEGGSAGIARYSLVVEGFPA